MNTQNPNFNAYDEAVESINLNETPEQVEARADACEVVQSITNDSRSEAQDALDVVIEGSSTEMEKIKTLDFGRVREFLKQAAMVWWVVLAPMLISSCEKDVVNPGWEVVTPVVDKTWAKEIEWGKLFDNIKFIDGSYKLNQWWLTILATPFSYTAKTVEYKPLLNKQKIIDLFSELEATFWKDNIIWMQIAFGYYDSYRVFYPITSGVVCSRKFPNWIIWVSIDTLPDTFTMRELAWSSTFVLPKDQKIEIQLSGWVGSVPNFKPLDGSKCSFGL